MSNLGEKTKLGVSKNYDTRNFGIAPSLAGCSIEYRFGNRNICIQLPARPQKNDPEKHSSPISCSAYWIKNNREIPQFFEVHSVKLTLDTGEIRVVEKKHLDAEHFNATAFNKTKSVQYSKLIAKYNKLLDAGFEHWVNTMRWKSQKHSILRTRFNHQNTERGPCLVNLKTDKSFYYPPLEYSFQRVPVVSKREWNATEKALEANQAVPIWHLYIAEANQKLELGDKREFIIDLAIASETLLRQVFNKKIIDDTFPSKFKDMINRISISNILQNWRKLGFNSSAWKKLEKEQGLMNHVIELRNAIMHRAKEPDLSYKRARELSDAILNFVIQGEKELT
ncbi:MAG: hypothetical protein ACIAZJ_21120 [Gimesia chilikensis]|uniref:hypothetical protein n=1 Tax=Gimesia chilikensis TaxID=2605989 RepID=UPI00378FD7F7